MAAAKGNIRQMRGYHCAKHRFARRMCGKYSGAVAANARAVTPSVFAGSRKQLNKKERAFLRKTGETLPNVSLRAAAHSRRSRAYSDGNSDCTSRCSWAWRHPEFTGHVYAVSGTKHGTYEQRDTTNAPSHRQRKVLPSRSALLMISHEPIAKSSGFITEASGYFISAS